MKKFIIAPSVLSANFMKLQEELELCKKIILNEFIMMLWILILFLT